MNVLELSTSSGLINSVVQKKEKKAEIGCCSFLLPFKPETLPVQLNWALYCPDAFTLKANAREEGKRTSKILSAVGLVPIRNVHREYESVLVADLERGHHSACPHPISLERQGNSGKTSFCSGRFGQPEDKLTNLGWLGKLEVNCSFNMRAFWSNKCLLVTSFC